MDAASKGTVVKDEDPVVQGFVQTCDKGERVPKP